MTILKLNYKQSLVLILLLLGSCLKDDVPDYPRTGENSFYTEINGNPYIPENAPKFLITVHGISALENNKIWQLSFSNRSNKDLHIYLRNIDGIGQYRIYELEEDLHSITPSDYVSAIGLTDGSGNFAYGSPPDIEQFIQITKISGDSILIGNFDNIILNNFQDSKDQIILTKGRFNINRSTLNRK